MALTVDAKSADALKDDAPMRVFYYPKACEFDGANLANSIHHKVDDIVQSSPFTVHHGSTHRFLRSRMLGKAYSHRL